MDCSNSIWQGEAHQMVQQPQQVPAASERMFEAPERVSCPTLA